MPPDMLSGRPRGMPARLTVGLLLLPALLLIPHPVDASEPLPDPKADPQRIPPEAGILSLGLSAVLIPAGTILMIVHFSRPDELLTPVPGIVLCLTGLVLLPAGIAM